MVMCSQLKEFYVAAIGERVDMRSWEDEPLFKCKTLLKIVGCRISEQLVPIRLN
ncbi:predicted protein [Botrytis cinerea T4]|uniref:Uncharacterized protein n=1 Tax=Botryotinia fuckeliana (strain T4) TaxID=999810 RepID=G2XPR3_BOTF4|nr:predicted protein [Botrytis cinerea T4]